MPLKFTSSIRPIKSTLRVFCCSLIFPLLSFSQYHGEIAVKVNAGLTIPVLSSDPLVFPERQDDAVAEFHHSILLLLKSGFGEGNTKLLTGIGYSGHFLSMKRYPVDPFVFDFFSGPTYKDSSLIQKIDFWRQGISFPLGFETKVPSKRHRGHYLTLGLLLLPEINLSTQTNDHGNFYRLDRAEANKQLERYKKDLPGFSLAILPQLGLHHIFKNKNAIQVNLVPLVINVLDSYRPMVNINAGFMASFEYSFYLHHK